MFGSIPKSRNVRLPYKRIVYLYTYGTRKNCPRKNGRRKNGSREKFFSFILLTENNFWRTFFRGPFFSRTIFPGTIFPRTIFPGTIFPGTNFPGTNFPGTNFPGTIFPGTIFLGDHFSGDHLSRGPFFRDSYVYIDILFASFGSFALGTDPNVSLGQTQTVCNNFGILFF